FSAAPRPRAGKPGLVGLCRHDRGGIRHLRSRGPQWSLGDALAQWRDRAVEPLVREALARLLPAEDIPAAPVIGGYWTRGNDVEIDIVGADREPVATRLLFLGSVKWLETGQFDDHDLANLQYHRHRVTPDPVPLIAVSRSGASATHADATFTA